MKNAFKSATSQKGLGLEMQSLGFGLERILKSWSWNEGLDLCLKLSLDDIIANTTT